ncbi:Eco57I restriction-modification methylase domain-containing protein, partial [Lacticaseibacillus paracasei]
DLKKFVKKYYKPYSGDLFSVFIWKNINMTKQNGYAAFMTPFVWMFIKTYESLRRNILENQQISSLIQMEYSAFEEATVPINTFV